MQSITLAINITKSVCFSFLIFQYGDRDIVKARLAEQWRQNAGRSELKGDCSIDKTVLIAFEHVQ